MESVTDHEPEYALRLQLAFEPGATAVVGGIHYSIILCSTRLNISRNVVKALIASIKDNYRTKENRENACWEFQD